MAARQKAIADVKSAGLQAAEQIREAGDLAMEYVDELAETSVRYGVVREEAATLEGYLRIAKNLGSSRAQTWQDTPRWIIERLLAGVAIPDTLTGNETHGGLFQGAP